MVSGGDTQFVGQVWLDRVSLPSETGHTRSRLVLFEPKARTNWHSHPGARSCT
jgi:quercetin dioxygenase-like cupin family protein